MPRKIELAVEYHPTLFKDHYDGFWPFTAILSIFAGFEGAMAVLTDLLTQNCVYSWY